MPIDKNTLEGIKSGVSLGKAILDVTGTTQAIKESVALLRQQLVRSDVSVALEAKAIASWGEVFDALKKRSYKRKFHIGDYVLDLLQNREGFVNVRKSAVNSENPCNIRVGMI